MKLTECIAESQEFIHGRMLDKLSYLMIKHHIIKML